MLILNGLEIKRYVHVRCSGPCRDVKSDIRSCFDNWTLSIIHCFAYIVHTFNISLKCVVVGIAQW